MSGWVTPQPPTPQPGPGPLVGWVAPDEPAGLSVGEIIRGGWRLTMSNLGRLALVAAVPILLMNLVSLPIWLSTGQMFERMFDYYANLDIQRYVSDPEGVQRELQAAIQPSTQQALISGIGAACLILIWMVGLAMITAATLDAAEGRRPTIGHAVSAALARPRTVIVPGILLALGYAILVLPLSLSSGSIAFADYGTQRYAISALLGFGVLILEIVAFYLAIRWSPYFQVVVAEDVGLRGALSRSSAVSKGVRIRIALALIAAGIAVGFVVALLGGIVALFVGIAAKSLFAGVVAWSIAFSIAGLVYLPLFAAMLTHVYRERGGTPSADADIPAVDPSTPGDAATDAAGPPAEPPVPSG